MIKRAWNSIQKHGIKKVFRNSIILITRSIDTVMMSFFRLFPIKDNYIFLESEGDFTDNIRVFYDYLVSKNYNQKYKLIWIVHDPAKYRKEKNVIFISRFHKGMNLKADYYAGVSKYFLFSHPYWLKNWRKEQIVIGTTHSVYQLKALPKSIAGTVDYVLACSDNLKKFRANTFGIEEDKVLVLGLPRIDLLYKQELCISRLLPNYKNEKVIVSMETFKQGLSFCDSNCVDNFALNFIKEENELLHLDKFLFEKNMYLLIKIHHLQNLSFLKMVKLRNIIYLTDDDLQNHNIITNDLLRNADILLTDYSSVFYEYLLLDRPIGFSIGDIEAYSRGFISDNPLSEMPGEKIRSLKDFFDFIEKCLNEQDDYKEEREEIKNRVFKYKDNNNCERLINWIENSDI